MLVLVIVVIIGAVVAYQALSSSNQKTVQTKKVDTSQPVGDAVSSFKQLVSDNTR
jgi:flagellar basal body-associated protein FliL